MKDYLIVFKYLLFQKISRLTDIKSNKVIVKTIKKSRLFEPKTI
jgi:hypothetical protein